MALRAQVTGQMALTPADPQEVLQATRSVHTLDAIAALLAAEPDEDKGRAADPGAA